MPVVGQISVGDGATFTPSVSNSGVISWSNDKNLPNPASVDIAGVVQTAISGVYLPTAGGTVTGNLTVNGTLTGNLSGNATTATTATTATNATTAASATNDGNGNEITATYLPLAGGTLTGNLTENNDLIVNGNANLNTLSTTGNATVGGALDVTGATTLTSVSVSGNTTVTDLTADNITVTNDLSVTGASTFTGNITAGADVTVTGDISANDITASGDITADDVTANGNLSVVGNATLSGVSTAVTPAEDDNSTNIATTAYVQTEIKPIETDVTINDKRISNIEKLLQGNLYDYQTDTDSKYTKTVPQGAMPYASLDSIGGKTLVWNQVLRLAAGTSTKAGVTMVFEADGTATLSGTATENVDIAKVIQGYTYILSHVYWLRGCPQGSSSDTFFINTNNGRADADGLVFTANASTTTTLHFVVYNGVNVDGVVIKVQLTDLTLMFGAGNEPSLEECRTMFPADYPYNAGTLLSAGVTEVVSKKADTTEIATYPIPTAIRNLEGYGWSAGSVYNYIDYEAKKFVQNVGKVVFDGTNDGLNLTNWRADENSVGFGYSSSAYQPKYVVATEVPNVVADKCLTYKYNDIATTPYPTFAVSVHPQGVYSFLFRVPNPTLTTATAINNYLSANPITVYYELATPQEIDISAYLTDDNLISVESGGTLTFPNSNGTDYQIPVPSAETYMVDLQSAL